MEKIYERYRLKPLLLTFVLFIVVAFFGAVFTPTKLTTMISLMLGLFAYLILPGYALLLNLKLDDLERLLLAPAIGLSIIPIILFNLNFFWIKTSQTLVISIIALIIIIGVVLKELKFRN